MRRCACATSRSWLTGILCAGCSALPRLLSALFSFPTVTHPAELKHGRLAMVAFFGYGAQAGATGTGSIIDNVLSVIPGQ